MMKSILSLLLLGIALAGAFAWTPAGPQVVNTDGPISGLNEPGSTVRIPQRMTKGRSVTEYFTLGSRVDDSFPVYSFANTIGNNAASPDLVGDVDYTGNDGVVVTQVEVHVEGDDDMEVQAYVSSGGLGERSISVQIVANNTEYMRYLVVVYGHKV